LSFSILGLHDFFSLRFCVMKMMNLLSRRLAELLTVVTKRRRINTIGFQIRIVTQPWIGRV